MKQALAIRTRPLLLYACLVIFLSGLMACNSVKAASAAVPGSILDEPLSKTKTQQTAVFSGGCFWGVQAVFEHVKGVTSTTAGYSGGSADTAHYEIVENGATGHAESVRVSYDSSQVTYGQLLRIFFSVAHDPTELNRQGPDQGTQYRSIIFYTTPAQQRIAQAYIDQLNQARVFPRRIVTEVTALRAFYPAEDYHQDYLVHHPNEPYIVFNDLPKLTHLREQFPEFYVGK
ncbi:MAG TPA: peptide-methionine (S)-S-oxide reductase MsrA [Verrucomicrobiae bacterium]|jgi:peptide-methionine (S)-S-oxide reductase|nr:peptide-methionine (S)-S-oxide reductase MsrA [Verrucomicrobiae bacterium]